MADLLRRRALLGGTAKQKPTETYLISQSQISWDTDIHFQDGDILEYEGCFNECAGPGDHSIAVFRTTSSTTEQNGRTKRPSTNKQIAYYNFNTAYVNVDVAVGLYATLLTIDTSTKTFTVEKSNGTTGSATWSTSGFPASTSFLRFYTAPWVCFKRITHKRNGVTIANYVAKRYNGAPCMYEEISGQYYYNVSGTPDIIPSTPLFVSNEIASRATSGTITLNSNYTVSLVSTAAKSWNLYYAPKKADAGIFPTYGTLKGKKIVCLVDTEFVSQATEGSTTAYFYLRLASAVNSYAHVRATGGKIISGGRQKFVYKLTDDIWTNGTTTITDSLYVRYGVALYADSGAELLVKSVYCYIEE